MVALSKRMLNIAAAISEFTDIPTLEIRTGRENYISKFCFSFEPNRLINHEFKVIGSVHFYITIGIYHSSKMRTTIFIIHFYLGVSRRGILITKELSFDRCRIGGVSFTLPIHNSFRNLEAGNRLIYCVHTW